MKMFPRGRRKIVPADQTVFSSAPLDLPLYDVDLSRLMWMEELREFLRAPGVDITDLSFLSQLYADYCSTWHAEATISRWNPRTIMNALGVALGDCLIRQIPGSRWQLTYAQGASYLVITAADGLILAAPLTELSEQWLARELAWVLTYPSAVLDRLPQPRDPVRSSPRQSAKRKVAQPQL